MSSQLRSRIGAARLVLESVVGTCAHAGASRTQCVALLAEVKKTTLTVDEMAMLSALAVGVAWAGTDAQTVAEAFVPAQKRPRNQMQDWTSIHEFLLKEEWDHMQSGKATLSSITDIVLQRVVKTGGRCLGEPSLKHVTSLVLALSEKAEVLVVMEASKKHLMMNHVRLELRRLVRRASEPAVYIEQLPPSIGILRSLYPALVIDAYDAGVGPVNCPLDVKAIHSISMSFRCRGGGGAAQQMVVQHPQQEQQQQVFGQMERFAGFILQGMGQMQGVQNKLLEHLSLNSGMASGLSSNSAGMTSIASGSTSSLAMGPVALGSGSGHAAAIQNSLSVQALAINRAKPLVHAASLPAVAPPDAAFAPPDAALARADAALARPDAALAPPDAALALADAALAPPDAALAPPESALAGAEPADSAVGGAMALLGMLEEREAEKKDKARAGKAMAKTQGKAKKANETFEEKEVAVTPKKAKSAAKAFSPKAKSAAKLKRQISIAEGSTVNAPKKPPNYCVERSRKQVMCRTGRRHYKQVSNKKCIKLPKNEIRLILIPHVCFSNLPCVMMPVIGLGGPGSSKKLTYGKGFDYPTEKAAVAAAEKWVKAEMKRQGITK